MAPRLLEEDDCCDHGIPFDLDCRKCDDEDDALFDADELGLDPETDDPRG